MSDDFVFVDFDENQMVVVDDISIKRLKTEWKAVKVALKEPIMPLSPSLWKVFISVLKQMNESDTKKFLADCMKDIVEMMNSDNLKLVRHFLFHLFIDIVMLNPRPFSMLPNEWIIPILSHLPFFISSADTELLDGFLEPFAADEICDSTTGTRPFLQFLVKALFSSDVSVSKLAKFFITEIISSKRPSSRYLLPLLLEVFIEYLLFCSDVSPTFFDGCVLSDLLRYCNNVLTFVTDRALLDVFHSRIRCEVCKTIAAAKPYVQFKTYQLFVMEMHHYSTMSIIIQDLVSPNGAFARNIQSWIHLWTRDTLKMLRSMLDLRCAAVNSAFFYDSDMDTHCKTYGFPMIPPGRNSANRKYFELALDAEVFMSYRNVNQELPETVPHVISVFPLIADLFTKLWTLPVDTVDVLFDLIERIAGVGSKTCYSFCFTPGKGLCFETSKLLIDESHRDEKTYDLFMTFVITMNRILKAWKPR